MPTLVIYPSVDGYALETSNTDYATMRAAGGDSANSILTGSDTPNLKSDTVDGVFDFLGRGILSFSLSGLLSAKSIVSVVLTLIVDTKSNNFGTAPTIGISGGTLANYTAIAAGDYDGFNATEYCDTRVTYANWTGTVTYTFNTAGLLALTSAISSPGYLAIFLRDSWDLDSTPPAWLSGKTCYVMWHTVDHATVANRPYLTVTYTTVGDGTPLPSIKKDDTTSILSTQVQKCAPCISSLLGDVVNPLRPGEK